jgi:hypothetical protein
MVTISFDAVEIWLSIYYFLNGYPGPTDYLLSFAYFSKKVDKLCSISWANGRKFAKNVFMAFGVKEISLLLAIRRLKEPRVLCGTHGSRVGQDLQRELPWQQVWKPRGSAWSYHRATPKHGPVAAFI